jgi:hypothetical protein
VCAQAKELAGQAVNAVKNIDVDKVSLKGPQIVCMMGGVKVGEGHLFDSLTFYGT